MFCFDCFVLIVLFCLVCLFGLFCFDWFVCLLGCLLGCLFVGWFVGLLVARFGHVSLLVFWFLVSQTLIVKTCFLYAYFTAQI